VDVPEEALHLKTQHWNSLVATGRSVQKLQLHRREPGLLAQVPASVLLTEHHASVAKLAGGIVEAREPKGNLLTRAPGKLVAVEMAPELASPASGILHGHGLKDLHNALQSNPSVLGHDLHGVVVVSAHSIAAIAMLPLASHWPEVAWSKGPKLQLHRASVPRDEPRCQAEADSASPVELRVRVETFEPPFKSSLPLTKARRLAIPNDTIWNVEATTIVMRHRVDGGVLVHQEEEHVELEVAQRNCCLKRKLRKD